MLKQVLIATVFSSFLLQSYSVNKESHNPPSINFNEEDYLPWSNYRRLSWDDFRGNTPPQTDDAALSTTYVGFSYSKTGSTINYNIECKFQKSRSWGRVKTDYILKHEQGHFDIAEIFARKLNKEVKEYLSKSSNHAGLNPIYTKLMNEKREMQEDYDTETNHSINKAKQAEWNKKIEEMLNELDPASDY